jgi:APA family basic amino acid/polyamine antiporter
MSAVMLLLFISAMSAMMLVGPRVYAAMAKDGFLPAFLAGKEGKPPTGAVVLQGAIALLLLFTHDVRSVLSNVGAIVVIFAALTVMGLFARIGKSGAERPSNLSLVAAGIYGASALWMLFIGVKKDPTLVGWVLAVALLGLGAFAATRFAQRRPA